MGIQSIQSGTDVGGSASSAADEPPRRNPKHKTQTIGRERAATRSARVGPKRVQPTKDTPCVVVVGTEPLALRTDMPALRLRAATRLHSGRPIAKLRSKSEYHTTWGAAVLAARCLSWDRKYQCIAGDDTARLAPGGTTPHRIEVNYDLNLLRLSVRQPLRGVGAGVWPTPPQAGVRTVKQLLRVVLEKLF